MQQLNEENEDIVCHLETLENESNQKKQASCTAIRLVYKMQTNKPTQYLKKDLNLEHLTPRFLQESISSISFLIDKFRKLDLINRSDIVRLDRNLLCMGVIVHRKLLEMVHLNLIYQNYYYKI